MGHSNEMAIAEANRNEAKEAITELRTVVEMMHAEVDGSYVKAELLSIWMRRTEKAIALIEKFNSKHQPEVERWK